MVKEESYFIKGTGLPRENKLPFFCDRVKDQQVPLGKNVLPEDKETLGIDNGRRVLPYTLQDHYNRDKKEIELPALALENEYLKALFLPTLGGRLASLYDKKKKKELLHRNPVFQPANLAIRNAWFSGGVEWNIGHLGHSVFTCSPLYAAEITGADGEKGLRFYEFERMKRLWWQMDIFLPGDSPYLQVTTRIKNEDNENKHLYWWTNIAVEEKKDTRILAPGRTGLFIDHETGGFGYFELPRLRTIENKDCTYPVNYHFANEFFFKVDKQKRPFVVSVEKDGHAFLECSTKELTARKLFVWGQHQGGQHWQDFLAEKGERYAEIQAGLAPTQRHSKPLAPKETVEFTELFGSLIIDPDSAHNENFILAMEAAEKTLNQKLPDTELQKIHNLRKLTLETKAERIIAPASGWGALEKKRANVSGESEPASHLDFPSEIMTGEQHYWLDLLENQNETGPLQVQPEAWIADEKWYSLLKERVSSMETVPWHYLLHLGIMAREAGDYEKARTYWRNSLEQKENYQAHRNLAVLYQEENQFDKCLIHYKAAWKLAQPHPLDLLIEYMGILLQNEEMTELTALSSKLSDHERYHDRIRLILIRLAIKNGELNEAENLISREFSLIREGEVSLDLIWNEIQDMKVKTGQGERRPIPSYLDYGIKG